MISVRPAIAADIDEFKHVIIESVLEFCKHFYTPRQIISLLSQYPNRNLYEKWIQERVLVVAEHDGKIIGFAQYFPPNNSIEALHVLPNFGKQGIGKKLIQSIEEIARNQGASQITLGSSLNAVGFYEKCGYTRIKTTRFKCNDGIELDVVCYEKELIDR